MRKKGPPLLFRNSTVKEDGGCEATRSFTRLHLVSKAPSSFNADAVAAAAAAANTAAASTL